MQTALPTLIQVRLDVNKTTESREELVDELQAIREEVNGTDPDLTSIIKKYTVLTTALLNKGLSSVHLHSKDDVWRALVSLDTLMKASDCEGLQRALGSSYFLQCGLSENNSLWFIQLEAQFKSLTSVSFHYNPSNEVIFQDTLNPSLVNNITMMKMWIIGTQYKNICAQFTQTQRNQMSSFFFNQMTEYMTVLSSVQANATSGLLYILNEDLRGSKKDVVLYSTVCAVITISSIIMGVWYASSIQQMMAKIQGYAKKV